MNRQNQLRYSELSVLFICGHTTDVIQFKGILAEELDMLMKPFTANTLLQGVREALLRSAQPGPEG